MYAMWGEPRSDPCPTIARVSFDEPNWDAPIDVDAYYTAIPAAETMKGMFLIPVVRAAAERGHALPDARERYLPFHDYPLREHMSLLVAAARALWPRESLRRGLRRLGRGAIDVLLDSTVGRVLWATADDPTSAIEATVKAYAITQPRSSVVVVETSPEKVIVRAERVHSFLDSHHIGVFEAALKRTGIRGSVTLKARSLSSADICCRF